jgi:acyl-CoA oxidase
MEVSITMSEIITSEWKSQFTAICSQVKGSMNAVEAAAALRLVLQSGLLELDDIERNPAKFFEAHRLLGQEDRAIHMGPGFGIRFTVHYNLFAGSVLGLGSKEQIAVFMARNKIRPRLGCFALTEVLAGVNSGMVVETRADLVDGHFVIDTPTPGAAKKWISQGLMADEAVLFCNLYVNGKSYGPQGFLIALRDDDGHLLSGITMRDMGKKTVGNDLDNAEITFTKHKVPITALLAKFISVQPDGNVIIPEDSKGLRTMDMIGQRLFTGRIAVAQSALEFAKSLFSSTKRFAANKKCWIPNGQGRLIDVPQINALFIRGERELLEVDRFLSLVEGELNECLRSNKLPPVSLQQAIAVGKVKAVECSIELCHALKQEVGKSCT